MTLRKTRRGWMTFNEADTGGGSGGEGAPAETPEGNEEPAAPEEEPKPEGDTLESKLASAAGHLKSLFNRLQATLGANTRLQSQFDALKQDADKAQGKVTQLEGDLKSEKDAHKLTSDKLGNSEKDVERLEGLCGLRGLSKSQVVPPASTDSTKSGEELYNEWQALKASNSKEATTFFRKHQSTLRKYADSLKK